MNRIMKFQVIFFVLICIFSANLFATENSDVVSVERFALYVSANNGGKERDVLRYATSDAEKLKNAMQEIGGVDSENSILLKEPKQVEVEKALQDFAEKSCRSGENQLHLLLISHKENLKSVLIPLLLKI